MLAGLLPSLAALTSKERDTLLQEARVLDAPAGTTVLSYGDTGDAAFFILKGKVAAGITGTGGNYRSLESMTDGDFFGEIAALTGTMRTADVVTVDETTLMRIPAKVLRGLMSNPAMGALFLTKMTERLNRSSLNELPRFAGLDQQVMRDLRTASAEG